MKAFMQQLGYVEASDTQPVKHFSLFQSRRSRPGLDNSARLERFGPQNMHASFPGKLRIDSSNLPFCMSKLQSMDVEPKAWLVMCAGDDREHGGNDGYADLPHSHYLWDSDVSNHKKPAKGDMIVLRNKKTLLGASVIGHIEEGEMTKNTKKCPGCLRAHFGPRSTMPERYKCNRTAVCGVRFNNPVVVPKDVKTYRSDHGAGWVDLRGRLNATQLHDLCINTNPQHSLREMRWQDFLGELGEDLSEMQWRPLERTADRIAGGHREQTVRVRLGQAQFRQRLLNQMQEPMCAFTGPAPVTALEAGHLYSYAAEGVHHENGGMLMRRDVHVLFDRGHLAIDPSTWTIDVSAQIRDYSAYGPLHGQPLHVPMTPRHKKWLALHWAQYRGETTRAP